MSIMINKTKFTTTASGIATIAVIATLGTIGGLGQQQIALARTPLDSEELSDRINSIIPLTCEDLGGSLPIDPRTGLPDPRGACERAQDLGLPEELFCPEDAPRSFLCEE
jgi:hypothetical protein